MTPAAHAANSAAAVSDLRVQLAKATAARDAYQADARNLAAWGEAQQRDAARLSAECQQLKGDVAKWRSVAGEAVRDRDAARDELADQLALLSEVLDYLKRPVQAPADADSWDVTVHVTAAQLDRWMTLGKVAAL